MAAMQEEDQVNISVDETIPIRKSAPHWSADSKCMTKDGDQLNYLSYAERLTDMLGDPKTSTPLTVGIFANWGQGKTSVMHLVEECITETNDKAPDAEIQWYSRLFFGVHCASCCRLFKQLKSIFARKRDQLEDRNSCKTTVKNVIIIQMIFILFLFATMASVGSILFWIHRQTPTYQNVTSTGLSNTSQNISISSTPLNDDLMVPLWVKIAVSLVPFLFVFLVLLCFRCAVSPPYIVEKSFWYKCIVTFFFYPEKFPDHQEDVGKQVELIMVTFNAWEYAGCKILWAGIIANICTKLVSHFGQFQYRLFRHVCNDYTFMKEAYTQGKTRRCKRLEDDSNFKEMSAMETTEQVEVLIKPYESPQQIKVAVLPYIVCGIPKHLFYTLVIFLVVLSIFVITLHFFFGTFYHHSLAAAFPSVATLGGIGVLATTGVKVVMQARQLLRAPLAAIKKVYKRDNMEKGLGAMHDIKTEVNILSDMVRYMSWLDQKQYRVVIFVDDLDRCDKNKVLTLLEAISILLSEPNTPFISLLAIDPRIIRKAVEAQMHQDMEITNQQSFLNGYEYLKKIIHLPFWLPNVSKNRIQRLLGSLLEQRSVESASQTPLPQRDFSRYYSCSSKYESLVNQEEHLDPFNEAMAVLKSRPELLTQNPRSMKRISNVLNLSIRLWYDNLLDARSTRREVQYLAWFIVLAEQWPYHLSLLAHIVEDEDKGPPYVQPEGSLLQVFRRNSHLLRLPSEWETFITFDLTSKKFEKALEACDASVCDLQYFMDFILNLDVSLRETFSLAVTRMRFEDKSCDKSLHSSND